jgi:hypothetical protein
MASKRISVVIDGALAEHARQLGINVSAAAREGVAAAARTALTETDRAAYRRCPEQPDPSWDEADVDLARIGPARAISHDASASRHQPDRRPARLS